MHNGELVFPQRKTLVLQEGGMFAEKPMHTHTHTLTHTHTHKSSIGQISSLHNKELKRHNVKHKMI